MATTEGGALLGGGGMEEGALLGGGGITEPLRGEVPVVEGSGEEGTGAGAGTGTGGGEEVSVDSASPIGEDSVGWVYVT